MQNELDPLRLLVWTHAYDSAPVDWWSGGFLFGAALVGAMLVLYTRPPTELPGAGGREAMGDSQQRLTQTVRDQESAFRWRAGLLRGGRTHTLANLERVFPDRHQHLLFLQEASRAAERAFYRRTVPLFLVLGPLVAAAVTTNVVQALVLGAAGPSALWARQVVQVRTADADSAWRELDELGEIVQDVYARNDQLAKERKSAKELLEDFRRLAAERDASPPRPEDE